jgi:tRNA threonylcarbamoyladenosine biosynthesis protein TsaB
VRILAIDTSTDACSCALLAGGELTWRHEVAPRRHAEILLPMIDELLRTAACPLRDLDAIAFGRGPGSFTGVRIAAGVTQGLALGASVPVVGISSLQTLAQGALRERGARRVLVALDARMGEVYWARFALDERGGMLACIDESVGPPAEVRVPAGSGPWWGSGSGFAAYARELRAAIAAELAETEPLRLPHAADTIALARPLVERGEVVDAARALPVYLRDRVTR